MRRILTFGWQALIEAEATAQIGAGRHERTPDRTTQRNCNRPRTVTTTAGNVAVAIPKTRTDSFFPSLLGPRRRIDRALHAVICEAYVHGVSTRKVDDLVVAMGGLSGVQERGVADLRPARRGSRSVRLPAARSAAFPYVFVDASYCKVRLAGQVSPKPSRSPPASAPMADGKFSATPSATARPSSSGPSSSAASANAA